MQFGGALAATLVPVIGAGGSVVMRLLFAHGPAARRSSGRGGAGHSRRAWRTVIAFGVALGLMNFTFYSSLAHLPIGVAVTIEFIGPLTLAAVLSRRVVDAVAVAAAGLGVVLISEALSTPLDELELGRHRAGAGGRRVLGGVHRAVGAHRGASSRASRGWRSPWSSPPS